MCQSYSKKGETMKIEVLVTTMHQTDISKYREMNLQTDAMIANQADFCGFEEIRINDNNIRFVTTDTRGVSLNRNIAISYCKGNIVVFADDDQVFVEGYEQIVKDAFDKNPDADAIKFYCESTNKERPLAYKRVKEVIKATKRNLMSAGVPGLAVRTEFLLKNNIWFDNRIGPGREISCGEDSVFLNELLKHKAQVYLSPALLSYVNQGESTWFKGYDQQFCVTVGYIYDCIYGFLSPLAMLRRVLKFNNKNSNISKRKMFFYMLKGKSKRRKEKR